MLLLGPVLLPADPIAEVRQAIGFTDTKDDLVLTGEGTIMKSAGPLTIRLGDAGKFFMSIKAPLGQTIGFEGTNVWEADYTGATRVINFGSRDRELAAIAVATNWWANPASQAEMLPGTDAQSVSFRLKGQHITPVVKLDAQTHLPISASFDNEAGTTTIALSDWHTTGRGKFPFSISITEGGVTDTMRITKESSQAPSAGAYAMPKWQATDTTFTSTIPPALETKRLPSGHICIKGVVNGTDLGWFILDSGAEGMCIDRVAAEKLGLPRLGSVPAVGVGGIVNTDLVGSKTFQTGPMTIKNLAFVELDLGQIGQMMNIELGGIIGYDVFRRAIVNIDITAPQVQLLDPTKYSLPGGAWQPIEFDGGVPAVQAKFEGDRTGWFRIDTGAAGTVTFHGPFVESMKLLETRQVAKTSEGGVGGMVESRSGPLDYFELAGHRFVKPNVRFSISKVGAFRNDWLVGNIGQTFFDPFKIVFDYSNSHAAFIEKK